MACAAIYAGICGFTTTAVATTDDGRNIRLQVTSECPEVTRISKELNAEPFDAFAVIGPRRQPEGACRTRLMDICGKLPHAACPVLSGLVKAVEVAAGLALPREATIRVFQGDEPEDA